MNKTTMYFESFALYGSHLHFNPGEAKEHNPANNYGVTAFHHAADISYYKENGGEAFRAHYGDDAVTDWYDTMSSALTEVPNDAAVNRWEKAEIHRPWLFPMTFPVTNYVVQGEKGLHTRLNLHPEVDGISTRGKLCFPHRDCADRICSGPIVITGVFDKGNYAFFTGHMVQYEWPSENELLDYIEKDGFMSRYRLTYVETEHFGKIIVLSEHVGLINRYIPCHRALGVQNGDIVSISDTAVLTDPGNDIRSVDVADLLCREYMGCDFSNLTNQFIQIPDQWTRRLRTRKYDRYISDLIDDAVDSGIVSPMILEETVFFYEFSSYGLLATIHGFSKEEIEEIIKTVNQTNMAAQEQIKSLAKRGKIRITVK